MSERHVIVGAGPVGLATAEQLADQGRRSCWSVARAPAPSRRGTPRGRGRRRRGPADRPRRGRRRHLQLRQPAVVRRVADVLAADRRGVPDGGREAGAVLVTGNLYPYGPVDGPMIEDLPDAATGTKA